MIGLIAIAVLIFVAGCFVGYTLAYWDFKKAIDEVLGPEPAKDK